MPARVLEGKPVAAALRDAAAARVAELNGRGVTPAAAVVRVGDDEGSASYAGSLQRSFARAGVEMRLIELPAGTPEDAVAAVLDELSADPAVHGIMLQEPVPAPLDAERLALGIAPGKDIDGVHPLNAGRLFQGRDGGLVPATALGGIRLLEHYGVEPKGRQVVVIGRSTIVGRPFALLCLHRHATVTLCHSRTVDLPAVARTGDILAVAVGRAAMVEPEWVKPGAVVVDFGVNFRDGAMCGDVAEEVAEVAGALTPTPGGTGAVTTAVLLSNLLEAASAA
ncbi:MAG: bifunctional 5,10-methylenetetrahydrofolate dehydrogenase/5,10-methenyltetrahydrofolate cyclohydrolase [Armatimonadetes bacterium]|nr:bifunctional 5,10-methylenetetrahydrofolate dehydrogenase/5,10-methenyltetrahydrofolate cyclohydrolase [Armatimonadota bacterium]